MVVALPCRGEFGLKIHYHVPAVHAVGPDVVMMEAGEEALYPSAKERVFVDSPGDDSRRGLHVSGDKPRFMKDARQRFPDAAFFTSTTGGQPRKRVALQPHVFQIERDSERDPYEYDVFMCPRKRDYGASKNWPFWDEFTDVIVNEGFSVFAGGNAEASESVSLPDERVAWKYERPLDATIEAMNTSRLVVATDAGLAHLAVLQGRPLVMIAHEDGIVAPGPQVDANGRILQRSYGPIDMNRYKVANHTGSPIGVIDYGWYEPHTVVDAVTSYLRGDEP